MKAEICSPLDLSEPDLERWRSLQREDPRLFNPFLSPEFARAKARHLKNQFVAVLQDGPDTVGFLPFERTGKRSGITRAFICGPEQAWDPQELLQACQIDVFEYEDLVHHQQERFATRNPILQPVPMIDLAAGWDAWLAEKKSSSRFKRILRKQRSLERELPEVHCNPHNKDHAQLDLLMKWKSEQFNRTGHVNRYANPAYREMVHELLDTETPQFSLSLTTLSSAERTLGLVISLHANNYVGAWQTTYDADPELDKYSVGMVLTLGAIEAAANEGFVTYDLGIGFAQYKEWLKNYDDHAVAGWSERPSVTAYLHRAKTVPVLRLKQVLEHNPKLRQMGVAVHKRISTLRGSNP